MKDWLKLCTFILLFISQTSWAGENTINYQISGVDDPLLENINNRLTVNQQAYPAPLSANDIQAIFQHAKQVIEEAIQPFGYFKPTIQAKLVQNGSSWTAQYKVSPGPALRINQLEIKILGPGKADPSIREYLEKLPLKEGDVFETKPYEALKEKLFTLARESGYIKAHFSGNKIVVDLKEYHANVVIQLETGPRYYFGNFSFNQGVYDQSFLNRFIPNKTDKPFSSQKLVTYQQSLSNSYYFDSVAVTPDLANIENYRVPVSVTVMPPKAKHYSLGVGYGTSTGPRLTAGVNLRRLTATGQHLDAQIKLSPILSSLGAKYYIPGPNPLTDQWVLSGNFQQFMPDNGRSKSGTLSAGYQTKFHKWQTNLNLNYLVERFKIKRKPTKFSRLLYPSLAVSYIKTDDVINPTQGQSLNASLQGGSKNILSTTDFLQARIKGKYLFSPFNLGRVILRGDLGYTLVDDLDSLPLSMRFLAGGLNSIRAFKDSSIGPGRYLAVGSVEYQHRLTGNWDGALFYDAGTASNHFDTPPLTQSKGVGLIYQSFIGPIKLYLAKKDTYKERSGHYKRKSSYGIDFSIGPEF